MSCRQFVIDYIEGRVTTRAFLDRLNSDMQLCQWLQSIVPQGKIGYYEVSVDADGVAKQETGPYDVVRIIAGYWKWPWNKLSNELNTHYEITKLFQEAFPQERIRPDKSIEEKFNFMLDACPAYIGGEEVIGSGILEEIYEDTPVNLNKAHRVKYFKEKVKNLFYIENNHYPHWLQEAEWPMSNGKPMKYLSSKKIYNGEGREYTFENPDTHDVRTVIQIS